MKKINIILDPAHGKNVAGKRSPDECHFEYIWSRDRCKSLENKLKKKGYNVHWTNDSEEEIPLRTRVDRANNFASKYTTTSILISLHNDALGYDKEWTKASGYSVYTTKGKTKSDDFAENLMKNFISEFPELKSRPEKSDSDLDREENFTVLTGSKYLAVLIEWLFQNNQEDLKVIKDPDYNERFENCIIKTIEEWK